MARAMVMAMRVAGDKENKGVKVMAMCYIVRSTLVLIKGTYLPYPHHHIVTHYS